MSDDLDTPQIIDTLRHGVLTLHGRFINGSNNTFYAEMVHEVGALEVVYKPIRGEQPLWDFPPHSLARREVAAFLVSEALGWPLVPLTIYRKKQLPFGAGSIQRFIPHDPQYHFFTFTESDRRRLKPIAVFDLLVNNADRKGGHILRDEKSELWVIDHGLCFNVEDKLRTVIWDFAGEPIPQDLLGAIERLLLRLENDHIWHNELALYVSEVEIKALIDRGQSLLTNPIFPFPSEERRPFPWPPI